MGGGRGGSGRIVRGRTGTPSNQVFSLLGAEESWEKNYLKTKGIRVSDHPNTIKEQA